MKNLKYIIVSIMLCLLVVIILICTSFHRSFDSIVYIDKYGNIVRFCANYNSNYVEYKLQVFDKSNNLIAYYRTKTIDSSLLKYKIENETINIVYMFEEPCTFEPQIKNLSRFNFKFLALCPENEDTIYKCFPK